MSDLPGRGELARNPALPALMLASAHLCDSGLAADHPTVKIEFGSLKRVVEIDPDKPLPRWVEYTDSFLAKHRLHRFGNRVWTHPQAVVNGIRFDAASATWDLSSSSSSTRTTNVPVGDGHVVSSSFLPHNGVISPMQMMLEYIGEIKSFLEVPVFKDDHRYAPGYQPKEPSGMCRLSLIAWRKPAHVTDVAEEDEEDEEDDDDDTAELLRVLPRPKYVARDVYVEDQIQPITRFTGRAALLPVFTPAVTKNLLTAATPKPPQGTLAQTTAHYEVVRLPYVL